jgi:hypothetical protein
VRFQASAHDWLGLLGIDSVVTNVFSGDATVAEARDALSGARSAWPGVYQDWVQIVDEVGTQLDELDRIIAEQDAILAPLKSDFEGMLAELPEDVRSAVGPLDPIPRPVDRLLNSDERERLARLPKEIEEVENAADDYAAYLAGLAAADPGADGFDDGWEYILSYEHPG